MLAALFFLLITTFDYYVFHSWMVRGVTLEDIKGMYWDFVIWSVPNKNRRKKRMFQLDKYDKISRYIFRSNAHCFILPSVSSNFYSWPDSSLEGTRRVYWDFVIWSVSISKKEKQMFQLFQLELRYIFHSDVRGFAVYDLRKFHTWARYEALPLDKMKRIRSFHTFVIWTVPKKRRANVSINLSPMRFSCKQWHLHFQFQHFPILHVATSFFDRCKKRIRKSDDLTFSKGKANVSIKLLWMRFSCKH